jgi:E3 ubiquitin-protein ligase MARCH6
MQVRPGVLASWIRDPMDPEYNPFREMVEQSAGRHAARVCMVLGVFGILGGALVHVPARLALQLAPDLFPLKVRP